MNERILLMQKQLLTLKTTVGHATIVWDDIHPYVFPIILFFGITSEDDPIEVVKWQTGYRHLNFSSFDLFQISSAEGAHAVTKLSQQLPDLEEILPDQCAKGYPGNR